MARRFTDRRSPLNALAAWLCIAIHLLVASASGWHAHPPAADGARCAASAHGTLADAPCDPASTHQPHPTPGKRDHQPDDCGLCKAILDLSHASLISPVAIIDSLRVQPAHTPAPRQPGLSPAPGRRMARGPPPSRSPMLSPVPPALPPALA